MKNIFTLRLCFALVISILLYGCEKGPGSEKISSSKKASINATPAWRGSDIKIGPDGLTYVFDDANKCIRKFEGNIPVGIITLPEAVYVHNNDVPEEDVFHPRTFEIFNDGTIYLGSYYYNRKIHPDGTITTHYLPGILAHEFGSDVIKMDRKNGYLVCKDVFTCYKVAEDDSFQVMATVLWGIRSMDICSNGVIWMAGTDKILRLTPEGEITVYGNNDGNYPTPPPYFRIENRVSGITVTRDGRSVYFYDSGKVKKLSYGQVHTIATIAPERAGLYLYEPKIILSKDEKQLFCTGDVFGGELLTVDLP